MSSNSSRTPLSKLSPQQLRQALRLIHCLQKERGASCAYSVSCPQFLSIMETARQQANVALQLFSKDRTPVATTLNKIRAQLDENCAQKCNHDDNDDNDEILISKFHRILVQFNSLIASVVHNYVLQHVNSASKTIHQVVQSKTLMKRCSSMESFIPLQTQRNVSGATLSSNNSNLSPLPPETDEGSSMLASPQPQANNTPSTLSPKSAARKGSRRRILSFDSKTMHSLVQPDPVICLLNLLSCFVRLKESTGLERALLSGMLSIGAVHPRLLADLLLEVENQSSLVEELRAQTSADASLLQLIREGVIIPQQLQELQHQILNRFNLVGIQRPSTHQAWNVITVYMDRLHSLELLLIEELESALAINSTVAVKPPQLEDTPAILQSILRDVYWQDLPADVIKNTLLEYIGGNTHSSQNKNIPALINRHSSSSLNGQQDEHSEWDISLYEIQFQKRIGRGIAGTTYLASWSGQEVAVKVAAITEMGLGGWKTETASLQRLHHPNIIRLLGSIYNPSPLTYCLVLEYCNAGDLGAALIQPAPHNFFDRVSKNVANGLAFLHSRDVIHRDIKPTNVLLHGNVALGDFCAKVTDFGLATMIRKNSLHNNRTAETGTYRWMAPEVIRHESYTETADVYSYGIVLWQLMTREDPFMDNSPIEAAGKVALELARPDFPLCTPKQVLHLIEQCWKDEPDDRPSFEEVSKELAALVLNPAERVWLEAPLGHPTSTRCNQMNEQELAVVTKHEQEQQCEAPASKIVPLKLRPTLIEPKAKRTSRKWFGKK